MKVYVVGGAVRDALLGLPVQDRDYVVVGASPQHMLDAGYKQVGADFPVFLHPQTHEEYALARTERKTGPGYKGFAFYAAPDVTLEEDLQRRDLTINAMAQDSEGRLIDPYGGARDLQDGVLRHVSSAFQEDPVRVLRVARFAARFGFRVADETLQLMRAMVQSGEIDALVPERVWQELARGLNEAVPSRIFTVLRQCGALAKIMPEVDHLFKCMHAEHADEPCQRTMRALDYAARQKQPLPVRFAVLAHALGQEKATALCQRLRAPSECRDLALLTTRWHNLVHKVMHASPQDLLTLFESTDAMRRPARFASLIDACACINRSCTDEEIANYRPRGYLQNALKVLQALDMQALTAAIPAADIPSHLRAAKLAALQQFVRRQP